MTLAEGGVRVASVGVHLPSQIQAPPTPDAAASESAVPLGIEHVHVAPADMIAPDLAVKAVGKASITSSRSAANVDLLLHAWTYDQGHSFWSPAHYIARELGVTDGLISGVQQMCNGGAVSLDVAMTYLASGRASNALLTTADIFRGPHFDRWKSDSGIVYGDGGTALLLEHDVDARPSSHYIRKHVEVPLPHAEALHRNTSVFEHTDQATFVDVRRTKKQFMERYEGNFKHDMMSATSRAVKMLLDGAIDDPPAQVRYAALPRLGFTITKGTYAPSLDWCEQVDSELASHSGHLGAGDLYANIDYAIGHALIPPGKFGLFISAGGGFTISATLMEATG
jgi:3-oxoacyl-[acyl-carrier-protein] synthase-3